MKERIVIMALVLSAAASASADKLNPKSTLTKATLAITTYEGTNNSEIKAAVTLAESENKLQDPVAGAVPGTGANAVVKGGDTEEFDLALKKERITPNDLSHAVLFIAFPKGQNPARDRWIFNYKLELTFSDGRKYESDSRKKVLLDEQNPSEYLIVGIMPFDISAEGE
jgi:hypothetical protein